MGTDAPVILIVSPELWDTHTVSKHHYAMALARRGCKVLFLDPPDDSLGDIEIRPAGECENLYLVSAPRVAPGLRFYPAWLRRRMESRWLQRLEKASGEAVSTIWLFENSRFFDMGFAGERLKIYHQVDLNQDFQVETAARTADLCLCTTESIRRRLAAANPHSYKVHHGVAIADSAPALAPELAERFTPGRIHAAYIGNLDIAYLDVALLAGLVKQFPDVLFHFVGSYREEGALRRACADAANVLWWGRVESALIPAILERCDILLLAYRAEEHREQLASPHKMMEYLASGKAVVATWTDEYSDRRQLLEMVEDSGNYAAAFARVVNHLEEYNSPQRQAERIAFAEAHSYEKQLDRIDGLLKKHGFDLGLPPGRA